jgi:hypothetical protein
MRMVEWLVPVATLFVGAVVGFFFRTREFRREQRLTVYGEFGAAFLDTAHAGSQLYSLHVSLGDTIYGEKSDKAIELWRTWTTASQRFEEAMVRLRLIASEKVRSASDELENFIAMNVRAVPPFGPASETQGWGDAAKIGPVEVDRAAMVMARRFADKASRDVTFWREK